MEFKTIQIMNKTKKNLLPGNIPEMFGETEGGSDLRVKLNVQIHKVCTRFKSVCMTICGVKLWNKLCGDKTNIKQNSVSNRKKN